MRPGWVEAPAPRVLGIVRRTILEFGGRWKVVVDQHVSPESLAPSATWSAYLLSVEMFSGRSYDEETAQRCGEDDCMRLLVESLDGPHGLRRKIS